MEFPKEKIKVLFIHHDGFISGSAISLFNLLSKLDNKLFDPHVVICSEGPVRLGFENLGIPVHTVLYKPFVTQPIPSIFNSNFYYNLRALFNKNNIAPILELIKPDIVHVNDKSALIAGRDCSKLGYKVVWHLRSSYCGKKSFFLYLISKWIIKKYSAHLISISEDEVDGFENHDNISIIYNSIDMEIAIESSRNNQKFRNEYGIKQNEVAIGMIGNLDTQKGVWNFIEAIKILKEKNTKIRFKFFIIAPIIKNLNFGWKGKLKLIDTRTGYERSMELVQKFGLEKDVVFTDRRNDVLTVMAGLDIVSAVYSMNAIGRPGFEAASVSRPIVVNKGHTGNSRIVIHGKTGFCVEKENPNKLADIFLKLASDRKLRVEIGRKAERHAKENFDSRINAQKVQSIYMNLLKY
jgi:glycosyltransferase involved in cell wall biosynthesis